MQLNDENNVFFRAAKSQIPPLALSPTLCSRIRLVFFMWLWSALYYESEHSVCASTTPASDLISSRTELRRGGPCAQNLCWPSFDKLSCCCIGQCCLQPKVIWQLLSGCRWATALQLLFPCLTLWMCLLDIKLPLVSQESEKQKATYRSINVLCFKR